jgi:hypothetical protein
VKTTSSPEINRAIERIRPILADLSMLERFEVLGLLALLEGIDREFTDEQLRLMFDSMRDRFVRSAWSYRVASRLTGMMKHLTLSLRWEKM